MRDGNVRRLSRLHRLIYETSGGVVGKRLVDNDMLLLTTRGRRSGRLHTVPLLYLSEGEVLIVVASYGGRDRHPEWYLNLVADPAVRVRTPGDAFPATARTVTSEQRSALWPRIVRAYQGYEVYQTRTSRMIPVVLLEPAAR